MREIKFRAWKKTNTPEMFKNVTSVDFKKNVVGLDYKVSSWTLREDTESLDNVILMQYTGLKDKNGVEIYEGDCFEKVFKMIEIPTGRVFEQTEVGVVKFDDGRFTCHINGWGHASLRRVLGYQNKDEDYWKDGLIIGNIYENPELLKQKKSS